VPELSVVITSFNSAETLPKTLASVAFADEIVVLDSFSSDETVALARAAGARVFQQEFAGFSRQKTDAIRLARHDWVLLLDSDEWLDQAAIACLQQWQQTEPQVRGYRLPRIEWVFWRWSHPWVHRNRFLRLFDRRVTRMSGARVHESPLVDGPVAGLDAPIRHFGETSIGIKMDKINRYSTLAAEDKFAAGQKSRWWRLSLYPLWSFLRQLLIRRQVFNGTAGWINAALNSHYAFLKYAKLAALWRQQSTHNHNKPRQRDAD
jgi:glycosyltransferase involved in cell wall biosynthesis